MLQKEKPRKNLLKIMSMTPEQIMKECPKAETLGELNEMLIRLCDFVGEVPDEELFEMLMRVREYKTVILSQMLPMLANEASNLS